MKNELTETLKSYSHWVYWELIDGRKVPINVKTGRYADTTNPETWATYDEVDRTRQRGFVLSEEDPFTVIDLDHCIGAQGQVKSEISRILLYFQSYTEVSPSGTGFHVWVRGKVPHAIKREVFEVYTVERYMTITENPTFNCSLADCQLHLDRVYEKYGRPAFDQGADEYDAKECREDLRKLYRVSEQLRRIWDLECDFLKSDGSPDCSSYDMALAGLLRDWSGEQITWAIKFFRAKHGFAPKHDRAIAITVAKALANRS